MIKGSNCIINENGNIALPGDTVKFRICDIDILGVIEEINMFAKTVTLMNRYNNRREVLFDMISDFKILRKKKIIFY